MRLQFVFRTDVENPIDINVVEVPTEYQLKAIEEEIYADMEKYIEESGGRRSWQFWFLYVLLWSGKTSYTHSGKSNSKDNLYYVRF